MRIFNLNFHIPKQGNHINEDEILVIDSTKYKFLEESHEEFEELFRFFLNPPLGLGNLYRPKAKNQQHI